MEVTCKCSVESKINNKDIEMVPCFEEHKYIYVGIVSGGESGCVVWVF